MAEYVISAEALERNARVLRETGQAGGAHMLVALKAYAGTAGMCCLKEYADGSCASGLYEAKLAAQHLGGHLSVYSPAYREEELERLLEIAHHIDFNSISQWIRFAEVCRSHPRAQKGEVLFGLRVNPCYSTGHTPLYDPCAPRSRLGVTPEQLAQAAEHSLLRGISGLHIHTLCEQGAQDLIDTFRAFERTCGSLLNSPDIRYLNLGGGHWITRPEYDREALVRLLREVREHYKVEVYLEPGEAWCLRTGVLRTRVLDVFESLGYRHAIMDVSVSAHTPDVLEMPYRPDVFLVERSPVKAGEDGEKGPSVCLPGESYLLGGGAGEKEYTYRLGAPTCLAGDVLGDYSFSRPLEAGDVLVLDDMTHYTIVKTTHFNGVPHPDIVMLHSDGSLECVRRFSYEDYADRQG